MKAGKREIGNAKGQGALSLTRHPSWRIKDNPPYHRQAVPGRARYP
jgi:hypothetical protein